MIKFIEADEPEDNFYAISKSNNPTQWILQGNETLEEEVFHDDISNGSWNLYGVSEFSFNKDTTQSVNYLLDNYTIGSEWFYNGTYFSIGYTPNPEGITWDGTYFYIVSEQPNSVYQYTSDGIYTGFYFNVNLDGHYPYYPRGITWDGIYFWIVGIDLGTYKNYVYQYSSNGIYTGTYFMVETLGTNGIIWDGTHFYILSEANDEVYQYSSTGIYTGIHWDIGAQETRAESITWDGTHFWVVGYSTRNVFQYDSNGSYTGIYFSVNDQGYYSPGITWDGTNLWVIKNEDPRVVCKYESKPLFSISKIYQGNGYMYMQTNKQEEIGLTSSVYESNISLKSGDYCEVNFETNSISEINLELIKDGLIVKNLILDSTQIFLDDDVEFNQLRFSSLFNDQDYLKIFDIKFYNVTNIAHYAEFYVDPFQSYSIYLNPTTYNLKILEGGKIKVDENIYIESPSIPYYYTFYSPIILINSPHSNELYGNISPSFNIEIKNNNGIDKMWYTLDNGLTNTTFTTNGTINQDLWDLLSNETAIISFYVKDSIGNIGTNSIIVRVDKVGPFIKINSPISNELFESTPPSFNVEISDANLDKMWYTINGGPTKYFFLSNSSLDSTVWSALPDGIVTIQFSANDTLGNIGFSEVAIRKDVNIPILVINNPDNNDVIGVLAPNFDLSIEEPHLDYTWYSLNGGNNITFTGLTGTIDQALWDALSNGNIIIRFYANDSAGNIGFSEVAIRKDVNIPVIAINNPQNSDVIGATAPNFDISIEEPNLDKTWYSLNGGNNITFTGLIGTINQALWDALSDGYIIIRFYATDSAGNIGFQEVTVVKTISQPSPPGIPGYNILLLLGIVSTIAVIIVKKRLNHLN